VERFGERLKRALDERGPMCVGIDPHPSLLIAWGLPDTAEGLAAFSRTVVEALADRVAVVKPQSAFYERFGSLGVTILESTIRQLRQAGALVILDVKRGDIGSTAAAYADAYLDPDAPMAVDAITASPFLGFGSLRPMIDTALAAGRGVFVLVRTSNPEGASVQTARTGDGRTVAQLMIDEIAQVNDGVRPIGDLGAVVGATIDEPDIDFTFLNGPVLVPGLGAQGGRPEALRVISGGGSTLVVPSYSREVLSAGPGVAELRAAAGRARDACARVLTGTT
jgi:orotidine-5'-phosphate decarboxylase